MNSSKLPQPTPPANSNPSDSAAPGYSESLGVNSSSDSTSASLSQSTTNQSNQASVPSDSSVQPVSYQPPSTNQTAFQSTTDSSAKQASPATSFTADSQASSPTASNYSQGNDANNAVGGEEPPIISSPIIEGLKKIDSQPFQMSTAQATSNNNQDSSINVPQESFESKITNPSGDTSRNDANQPPGSIGNNAPSSSDMEPARWRQLLSNKKILAGIATVLLLVVSGVFAWSWWMSRGATTDTEGNAVVPTTQTKLVYWGLWEDEELVQPLIDQYEQQNPGIDISYEQQNKRQYRDRLQAAIQQGRGPDIFRFHNTWVPMLEDQLSTAPRSQITAQQLEDEFYPVMAQDLTKGNQVVGIPLMYDGLALVYNTSMLAAANAQPPQDWRQVREVASRLAVQSEGRLERGGIAMGTADNVDHFSDILALLMLQNGASPGNPGTPNAQTALEFYTIFSRLDGVWDTTMAQSTLAFANEQVAMILVPSWRLHQIEQLNPNLNFGVAPVPQLSDDRISWATYWVEGVSQKSAHQEEAWRFLNWLSQPEQLRTLYDQATKFRRFGELYPRVEMASELSNDPMLAPYLEDALYARSWPLADATHDDGLNDKLKAHYLDAVNLMNDTGDAERSLEQVSPGIQQALSMYGVAVRALAPSK